MAARLRDTRTVALLLVATLTIMSNATISPGLPDIQALFADAPNSALLTRLLVTAPSLVIAVLAPVAGMTADRFGRRPQLLAGVVLFAIAGTAGLYLPDLTSILASRLVLGLAVAMLMTSQAALVGDYFAGEERARFMGYQMASTSFGGSIFITMAGFLAPHGARLPFAVYGLGILLLPLLWRSIAEPERAAVSKPTEDGPSADMKWLVPIIGLSAMSGLTFVIFYVMPTQAPYYLREVGNGDPRTAGVVMALVTLTMGCTSLLFGRLHRRFGSLPTGVVGYFSIAVGFLLLGLADTEILTFVAGFFVGAGLGFTMPAFVNATLANAPPNHRGLAMGIFTTSIFLGQFLSPVFSQPMIDTIGYVRTFEIIATLLATIAVAAALGLAFTRRRRMPS